MIFPKAAECIIMNITSLDCFRCCCSYVQDYERIKKKERKKERKRHINTYGNILPTYGRNSLVLYCYSTIILLQVDFKTSVHHLAAICTNIVKPLSTVSEGN